MWLSNSCFLQAFPVENQAPLDVAKVLLLTSWLCEDIRLDMSILLTYSRSSLATKWWVCEMSCLLLMLKTAQKKTRGQQGPWMESLCRWCCVSSVSSKFSTFVYRFSPFFLHGNFKKRGMVVKHHHRALWLCLFLLWRIRELGVLFAGPGRVTRDTPGIGKWLQVLESVQGASAFLSETLKKIFSFW